MSHCPELVHTLLSKTVPGKGKQDHHDWLVLVLELNQSEFISLQGLLTELASLEMHGCAETGGGVLSPWESQRHIQPGRSHPMENSRGRK